MSVDLFNEIFKRLNMLEETAREITQVGYEYAEAEREYRTELSKEILNKRHEGFPVTITPDVVRGMDEIADLRFERDCKEVTYNSMKEIINVYKLAIRVLENQLEREWRG